VAVDIKAAVVAAVADIKAAAVAVDMKVADGTRL
jgi:hypothetical protein